MGCPCFKSEDESTSKPEKDPLISSSVLRELSPEGFTILKIIGRGNFGKVCLVEKKTTKELFAMKILKKKIIEEKNQRIHTITERKILENSKSPFIARLYYAFQTTTKLFMVMEYLNGGELFFHLTQQRVFSELRAKFYIGEILLGLEYLHNNGIVYRDLKPENVMLDSEGHIRLTDFGLSKSGIGSDNPKAFTFCGTAEYLAPEILKSQGYDQAVDFWSLGALMYYMLSGAPPYYSKNRNEIFRNVLTRPIDPLFNISMDGNDLLLKLLKIDPSERIHIAEDVKAHPWFDSIDWQAMAEKKVTPPFKPSVKNMKDTSNFDKTFTNEKVEESFDVAGINPSPNQFSGFTYKDAESVEATLTTN
ncbi:hypothetical protein SteCoe_28051 [Stentor coeruleus]|uniref:Protein kinase domain-containing protein n=1 Tax=Stentor coeruleus TaxID=5963 RepID=A0A1R2B961_9CILI|nr:hypothetical protein SteCoe_28051 [Stentor coeruleus]